MDFYTFDDDYVRRLREGDRWTEEHFVAYFQSLLLVKLRRRLRTMAEISDVRQEVFKRVFATLRSSNGVRDGRKLGAFVSSMCNNVLLEWYRVDAHTEPLRDVHLDVAGDSDVEQAFATTETRDHVRRILALMPPKDAELLRLFFLEERDKDEICHELGVDRDYLRVLLHRAKEKFRTEYRTGRIFELIREKGETKSPSDALSDE